MKLPYHSRRDSRVGAVDDVLWVVFLSLLMVGLGPHQARSQTPYTRCLSRRILLEGAHVVCVEHAIVSCEILVPFGHFETFNGVEARLSIANMVDGAQYDKMPIPVPSMGQQRAFVTVAEQADKSKQIAFSRAS